MTIHHSLLLVEGRQDSLFLSKIFQLHGFRYINNIDEVPGHWSIFINQRRKKEHQAKLNANRLGLQLHELFEGVCLIGQDRSIVIQAVGGKRNKFRDKLDAINVQLTDGLASLNAIGLLPDADDNRDGAIQSSRQYLQAFGFTESNGQVNTHATPAIGIFTLPNGQSQGGLEELLHECASVVYPNLLNGARQYVDAIVTQQERYASEDIHEMRTPQGPAKAVVGCIASVLAPGATIQVSLDNHRWVCETSIASTNAPSVNALTTFLRQLCGLF